AFELGVGPHRQSVLRAAGPDDWLEVLERIIGKLVPIQAWQGGERQWRDEDGVAVRLGLCDRRIPDQRITARAVLYYDRCVPRFGQIVARSACQRVVKSARRIRHNNAYWPLRVGVCGLRLCDAKRAHCEACRRKECGKRFRDHFCLLDPWAMSL